MPLQKEQLSRMTIHGFKSIKSCDISFGKINVLIGSNGAGKSNFYFFFFFPSKHSIQESPGICWSKRFKFSLVQRAKRNGGN